jgi:hypothetical protein
MWSSDPLRAMRPSCLLRAMWPFGSPGIMRPSSHLGGHVAMWLFEGAMCLALIWLFSESYGHLALFGAMCPSGPLRNNIRPKKSSWLIKSSYENVISWPGLALGLSEDFIRPDGHMATWSLKELDGHMALEGGRWPSSSPKGPDGHMAHQTDRWP